MQYFTNDHLPLMVASFVHLCNALSLFIIGVMADIVKEKYQLSFYIVAIYGVIAVSLILFWLRKPIEEIC